MTPSKIKTEMNDVQFKSDQFRNIAKTVEFIVLAATIGAWMILNLPNLLGAAMVLAGYLIVNGVLYVNLKPLKEKFKELKNKL